MFESVKCLLFGYRPNCQPMRAIGTYAPIAGNNVIVCEKNAVGTAWEIAQGRRPICSYYICFIRCTYSCGDACTR